jgi:uncharacterized protein YfaS (alpha-2-macroglobulin family)
MKPFIKFSYFFAAIIILLLSAACGSSQPQLTATQPQVAVTQPEVAVTQPEVAVTPSAATAALAQPTASVTVAPKPTTPSSLLKGGDASLLLAPKVIGQSPASQEEARLTSNLEVSFDQPMDQAVTSQAWQLKDPLGKSVSGKVSWPTPRTLRFTPSQPLQPATEYNATLLGNAVSKLGVKISEPLNLSFITVGDLQISQVSPADGSSDIDNKVLITIIFNRPVVPLGMSEDQAKLPQPLVITPTVEGKGEWLNTSVFVFRPDKALNGAATYSAVVKAGLADADGLALAQDYKWQFTVMAPSIDSINLPDLVFGPPEGFVNVPLDQTFEINFHQPMEQASTQAAFSITSAKGKAVSGTFNWDQESTSFRFKPDTRLALGTNYTLNIATSAQSAQGGTLVQELNWHFSTVFPPAISSTMPSNGEMQAQFAGQLEISFVSPMKQSSLVDKVVITPKPPSDAQWIYNDYSMYFYGLEPSTHYVVNVLPGMEDIYGNAIAGSYSFSFTTAAYPPSAYFLMPYTPSLFRVGGPQEFYASVVNVRQVKFSLYGLTPRDFVSVMDGGISWSDYQPPSTSLVRTWTLSFSSQANKRFQDPITLKNAQGNALPAGIYYLTMDTNEIHHETRVLDARLIMEATANLTLKTTSSEAMVWLTDLTSGAPLANSPVQIYDPSFNVIGEGSTDAKGLLHLNLPVPLDPSERRYVFSQTAGASPVFAAAVSNWDINMPLNAFGVWPDYYIKPNDPMAYVYTDRPIYRPGQTVYFKGIVRLNDDLKYSLPDQKVVQVTISSFEATVLTQTLNLQGSGSFEGQLVLDNEAAVGSYFINVSFPGKLGAFGGVDFNVAEYRKPEFQLDVSSAKTDLHAGESFTVSVGAEFYSGGPVVGADVNWVLSAAPYSFYPTSPLADKGFSFEDYDRDVYYTQPPTDNNPKIISQGKAKTDENGKLMLNLPANLSDTKTSQLLTLEANVTDPAGNEVSGRVNVTAHASDYYPGIKADRYVGIIGESQSFSVVAVDWNSQPAAGQSVDVDIVERLWHSVQQEDAQGHLTWTSAVEDIPVKQFTNIKLDANGQASVSFTPDKGGVYRARVTVHDLRGNSASASTYLWVSGSDFIPWRQANDQTFDLVADKESYLPGDTAEILIASPFQGKAYALVTVERGHVLSQDVVELNTNSTIYKLPISPAMAPNTYVSVMVVKGVDVTSGKQTPPSYKFGLVEIKVGTQQQTLKVEVTPDKTKAGPGDQVTYTIRTSDYLGKPVSAEVSLSLVDLAVLNLTAPNSQPMLDAFYSRRSLSVETTVPLAWSIEAYNAQIQDMLPQGQGMGSGGGGKGEGSYGVFEVRGNFQDTAFWKARVVTGVDGTAQATVTLPDNLTTWRMDARAVTDDTRVGQVTSDILSTKPLLVSPQAPRFFVVNDQAYLSASVHNNTDQSFEVAVSLDAQGLTIADNVVQNVNLAAKSQAVVGWNVKVNPDAQRVDLIFRVAGGGYTDASRPTLGSLPGQGIPVYNYQVAETVGTAGLMSSGGQRTESVSLPEFPDFTPTQGSLTVEIAPSLAAGMTDGLTYLKDYSYACTEQTVSSFLPNILSLHALQVAGVSDAALQANLQEQVNMALQRLYNQQHADGGWGWWPSDDSDLQVSAYAVLGLTQAKATGYPVNQDAIDRGVEYISQSLQSVNNLTQRYILNRQAFVLYVMAKAQRPNTGFTVNLYSLRQYLSFYARAYLAQALFAADPKDSRLPVLVSDLVSNAALSATGAHWDEEGESDFWNWNTNTRSTAIILDALIQIDPKNPINENAVRWLMATRSEGRWQGTQETAWSLMALTDWMTATGELNANYRFEAALNGQYVSGVDVNPANIRTPEKLTFDIANLLTDQLNRLTIARSDGPGSLYYTAHLNVSLPVAQVKALDRGVSLTRSYFNPDDLHTAVTETIQGDVLLARITIVAPHDLHYVVIEDPLPAGLEVIDASLITSQQTGLPPSQLWRTDTEWQGWGWWYFDHVELRDEKVVLSVDYLPAGTYEYTYRVRAATPGTFSVISTTANEFYFPEVYGRGDGSVFIVKPKGQ